MGKHHQKSKEGGSVEGQVAKTIPQVFTSSLLKIVYKKNQLVAKFILQQQTENSLEKELAGNSNLRILSSF